MQTFEIEFETVPNERIIPEVLEAARALTERTAELLEERAEDHAAEHEAAAATPDLNGAQALSSPAPATPTDDGTHQPAIGIEPAPPVFAEINAAVRAALQAKRSALCARGHYMGETVGAYVGCIIGGRRVRAWSNHYDLNGAAFQIRTINGSQITFTVNRDTEDEKIIVAAKKRDKQLQGISRYNLYGVLRDDAFACAKKSRSRGHVNSGHQLVSLSQVQKVELGSLIIPDELVVADTSEQRSRLLDRIKMLAPDLDNPTMQAARTFLSEPVHVEPEALDTAATVTDQPAVDVNRGDESQDLPDGGNLMHIIFDHNRNLLGGPQGPPNTDTVPVFSPWIPIVDPGKVWDPYSQYKYVSCLRLTPSKLQVIQEAMDWEPLGRYGDYPDGSDIFWSFDSEEQMRDTMGQACDALSALKAPNTGQAAPASAGGSRGYEAETPKSTIQSPAADALDDDQKASGDRLLLLPDFDYDEGDLETWRDLGKCRLDHFAKKRSKSKPRKRKPKAWELPTSVVSSGSVWAAAQADLRRKRTNNFRA